MTELFAPFDLGGLKLNNRVVMAPMTRSRSINLIPDENTADYYAQRASAGFIITEGVPTSAEARGYLYTPGIYSPEQVAGWKKVTEAVHAKDGKIAMQLWHVGRVSHVSVQPDGKAPLAPVDTQAENNSVFAFDENGVPGFVQNSKPRAMTLADIEQVKEEFAAAAANAIEAGFDAVEIHGANGYLLEQFVNAGLNTRRDQYGGATIEGRLRFILEVVDAVVARIGSARTGIRLTPFNRLGDLHAFADEEATWLALAAELSKRDLAFVHAGNAGMISVGASAGIAETIDGQAFFKKFRKAYQGTLIVAGGYTADTAQQAIEQGLADLVAFGRPFVANPDLVERMQNNWPLAMPDQATLYSGGNHGYTDYPFYQPAK